MLLSGPSFLPVKLPSSAEDLDGGYVGADCYPRIKSIQLSVLSGQRIRAQSVRDVRDNSLNVKHLPKLGGPNDPAMGPCDRHLKCSVCGHGWDLCTGHHGCIPLPLHLYHPGYFDSVFRMVQVVCWVCGAPRGALHATGHVPITLDTTGRYTLQVTHQTGKGKPKSPCAVCGAKQPTSWVKGPKGTMVIHRKFAQDQLDALHAMNPLLALEARRPFTPTDAWEVLSRIRDEDVAAFGMDPSVCRPEDMIITNVVVVPPNVRPAVMPSEDSTRRGHDDLTSQLQDIIKCKRLLERAILKTCRPGLFERNKAVPVAAPNRATGGRRRPGVPSMKAVRKAAEQAAAVEAGLAPDATKLNLAAVLAPYLDTAEFEMAADAVAALTIDEVKAVRELAPETVVAVSPDQAAAVWSGFPLVCEKLQNAVATYLDNSGKLAPQSRQRAGAVRDSLGERLCKKTGHIRGNVIGGKRVDFCMRAVISPDTSLDVDTLGIPYAAARVLTVPEAVSRRNVARLRRAVDVGYGKLEGATIVRTRQGAHHMLQYLSREERAALSLQPGDVVHRHLQNGDLVLFNRQPSLHTPSIQAHRVRLVGGLSIRVPLAVTPPYNADFDGDEMNVHVVQDAMAYADAHGLMRVRHNVISPQNNAPIIAAVQDSRVGAFLFTSRHTFLTRLDVDTCLGVVRHVPPGRDGRAPPPAMHAPDGTPYWTGKQIISCLLPRGLYVDRWVRDGSHAVDGDADPQERHVVVWDGDLVSGMLCKATLGGATGGLVHKIATQFGRDTLLNFLSDLQRLVAAWLPTWGLSTGWEDCVAPPESLEELAAIAAATDAAVTALTSELLDLQGVVTSREAARAEAGIQLYLSYSLDLAQRVALRHTSQTLAAVLESRLPWAPRGDPATVPIAGFRAIVDAGSKGSVVNLAQVMCQLGQQSIDGRRQAPGGAHARTLPMFPSGAPSAVARGFVTSSFAAGLKPAEYWAHMAAGREGLVRTAVGTKITGSMQRNMTKGMELNVVAWDGSVRGAHGVVLQLVAGGDGMDPTHLQRVCMKGVLTASRAEVEAACGGAGTWWAHETLRLQAVVRAGLFPAAAAMAGSGTLATTMSLPLNVRDEVVRFGVQGTEVCRPPGSTPWTPTLDATGLSADDAYCTAVINLFRLLETAVSMPEAISTLKLAVLWECRPGVLRAAGLTAPAFLDTVGTTILRRTLEAAAPPGQSVGILAAQSIGEPATQLTLNAFHLAGLVLRRMTVGQPRFVELVGATQTMATPALLLPFKDQGLDAATAERLARSLVHLTLSAVLQTSYVVEDPAGTGTADSPLTRHPADAAMMAASALLYGSEWSAALEMSAVAGTQDRPPILCPWIVRMQLNRAVLEEHSVTPEDVARAIGTSLAATATPCLILYSQPSAGSWVVRVRPVGTLEESACRALHVRLRCGVVLGGIPGIRDARVVRIKRPWVNPDTGAVQQQDVLAVDAGGPHKHAKKESKGRPSLAALTSVPWIDWKHAVTNDVRMVEAVLGIAAASTSLFTELYHVVSNDGTTVDPRHFKQLTATMTHRGSIVALNKFGINRADTSPFLRASYEESADMLYQAAVSCEVDRLDGMSQAVLAGQKAPLGTGTVTVVPALPHQLSGHGIVEDLMAGAAALREEHARNYGATVVGRHAAVTPFAARLKGVTATTLPNGLPFLFDASDVAERAAEPSGSVTPPAVSTPPPPPPQPLPSPTLAACVEVRRARRPPSPSRLFL